MYESTWKILKNLYDKLSVGGYAIVDDYNLPACRSAVDDFRKQNNISDEIKEIDGAVIFWIFFDNYIIFLLYKNYF